MKLTPEAQAALARADTRGIFLDMTPERKQKFERLTRTIVDLLTSNTEGPLEAYMLLHLIRMGFEEQFGIRGGIVFDDHESMT